MQHQHQEPTDTPNYVVTISNETWYKLRLDPQFPRHWNDPNAIYHMTVLCMMKNLTLSQMLTVLYIHQKKHGRQFSVEHWQQDVYETAFWYSYPFVNKFHSDQYWSGRRRICGDKKARLHAKLRVSYYLMNVPQATIAEIAENTGIVVKTVQNSVAALKDACKVIMVDPGIYQTRQSFYWDRCGLITSPDGLHTCADDSDDEHPAMSYWGQTINERHQSGGLTYMTVYNYTQDRMEGAVYDAGQVFDKSFPDPMETEWVVNHDGDLVANGGCYGTPFRFTSLLGLGSSVECLNGNRLDFRACNVAKKPNASLGQIHCPPVDYLANLMAA